MSSTLKRPSESIHEIQLEQVEGWNLFKFSDVLQDRMENLLDKRKVDQLTPDKTLELEVIGELDRIFPISMPCLQPKMAPSKETRQIVRERARYLCEYCHSPERLSDSRFTVDHIIPKSLGG